MIIQTITDDYHFWNWVKHSDSYSNNFSLHGAKALQDYIEELSEDIGEAQEFDPIAWCCEWSEYINLKEAYKQHMGDESDLPEDQRRVTDEQILEFFQDNTHVIEVTDSFDKPFSYLILDF